MWSVMLSGLTGSKLDTEEPCTGVLVKYGRWKMRKQQVEQETPQTSWEEMRRSMPKINPQSQWRKR